MFTMTVSEEEIQAVHDVIKGYVYPEHINRTDMLRINIHLELS